MWKFIIVRLVQVRSNPRFLFSLFGEYSLFIRFSGEKANGYDIILVVINMYENEKVEFKLEKTDEIYKEVLAFINADGGLIYIGVDDEGNRVGLKDADETFTAITNGIRDNIEPDATMFIKYTLEKDRVLRIEVNEGSFKPYYLKSKGLKPSGVYIRQGVSKAQVSYEQIRQMIKNTDGDSFEVERSLEQNLSMNYMRSLFIECGMDFDESKAKTMGIIDINTDAYTNLGLLVSDECDYSIKVGWFNDDENVEFYDSKEFTGSVLKQYLDAYEWLSMINKKKSIISGKSRIDTYDYPPEAIREALANAIVHRDYGFSGSIIINVNKKQMEIISLGGLVKGLTEADIMNGISQSRNVKLAEIFHRLKWIESYGTGMKRIQKLYSNSVKKPAISIAPNSFKITLPNMNEFDSKETDRLSEKHRRIISSIENDPHVNDERLMQITGLKKTRLFEIIKELESLGILSIEGRGKSKKYKININNN